MTCTAKSTVTERKIKVPIRISQHCHSSPDSKMQSILDGFDSFLPRSDRRLVRMLLMMATFFFIINAVQLWQFSSLTNKVSQNTLTNVETIMRVSPSQGSYPVVRMNMTSANSNDGWSGGTDRSRAYFTDQLWMDGVGKVFCMRNSSNVNVKMPSSSDTQHPIFLWGIPSTVADKEVERRKLLRSTYLNFFRDFHPPSSGPSTGNTSPYGPDRICSLQEWTCRYHELGRKCQLIYVFFIGGGNNETAPPYILDESLTDFRQMLVSDYASVPNSDPASTSWLLEPGVVYLNIRENQFDGKMTTWFQLAALVGREYPEIDYAAKVDSDLLLLTPNFFDYMERQHEAIVQRRQSTTTRKGPSNQQGQQQQHESTITRVYGGVEFPDINCELNKTFDHPCPLPLVGRSYMSGELNFMSMDLARYIASDDCPREKLTIPHEDVSLSNYVYSYTSNHAYHKRIRNLSTHDAIVTESDETNIDIISVNTTQILLTTTTLADWHNVKLSKQPELYRQILWGHSIKRGNYKRYLVWKEDKSFKQFWDRFMMTYANLVGGTSPALVAAKKRISALKKDAGKVAFQGLNSSPKRHGN